MRRVVSFDTETHLLKQGLLTPRMVCLSYAQRPQTEVETGLVGRDTGLAMLCSWLSDDSTMLVGHNVFYDLGVAAAEDSRLLPQIFEKFQKGLVHDTALRQQMIDNARGQLKFVIDEDTGEVTRASYKLADLSYRLLKKFLKKTDTWRLKYALLDGVPIEEWPEDAKKYAIDDAVTTLQVYEAQESII